MSRILAYADATVPADKLTGTPGGRWERDADSGRWALFEYAPPLGLVAPPSTDAEHAARCRAMAEQLCAAIHDAVRAGLEVQTFGHGADDGDWTEGSKIGVAAQRKL